MSQSVRLHCKHYGDPSRPALLFLHGFLGSIVDWQKVIDDMSRDYFCIAVDLPWHGKSPGLPATEDAFAATTAALLTLLQEQHVLECTVVGYSMGGRLAMYAAVNYPRVFKHAIVESANPGIQDKNERSNREQWEMQLAQQLRNEGIHVFLQRWYEQPLFAALRHHSDFELLLARRRLNDSEKMAQAVMELGTANQPDLWQALARYPGDMLFLAGEYDGKYAALAKRLAGMRPQTTIAIIRGCGHTIHFEKCTIFCKNIRAFLDKTMAVESAKSGR